MIESFRNKGLKELFDTGQSGKVPPNLRQRCLDRIEILDAATDLKQLNLPGYDFHPLHTKPVRYSIHINGPWCITFEWQAPNARRVDLEQYH
ncbi:MAG TPA: type II toxin-antitoxin system RelE/ParE family toxin [Candidatus Binatus sp.]|nr:type II toxin-antitoxin system RelE/ParE family toxin [Candidatus Binatus sp.]